MATITGTLANDTLYGTGDDSETMYGLDGDDVIYVGWGKWASIYGGAGNDRIVASVNVNNYSESTRSDLYGGEGSDTYVFNSDSMAILIKEDELGSGVDTLEFGIGITLADLMIHSNGGDDLGIWYSNSLADFNEGADIVVNDQELSVRVEKIKFSNGEEYTLGFGGDYDFPSFTASLYFNNVIASDDDNEVTLATGYYNFYAGGGNDIIHGTSGVENFGGGYDNRDIVYAGDGDDIVYGYGGADYIIGGAGNDYLDAGTGNSSDQLYGEDGDDILIGSDFTSGGYFSYFEGGNGNDKIYIKSYSAEALGDEGSDELYVEHMISNEHLTVNNNIILRGGEGNDVYIFNRDDANNVVSRKAGIIDNSGNYDTIYLDGDFNIGSTSNDLSITGLHPTAPTLKYYMIEINANFSGNIIERVAFSDGSIYSYGISQTLSQIVGTSGNDTLYLTAWHDDFHAGAGDDTIYALERDDIVDGGDGNDTLYGEDGDDTLIGGVGNDTLDGGVGIDTADYTNAAAGVEVVLHAGTTLDDGDGGVDTLVSIENIIGSAYADTIDGDNGRNVIHGNAGADIIYAYSGNDEVYGDDGDDEIYGDAGDDIIYGGMGNDFLSGRDDNDQVYGEDGDDTLYGGNGVDELYGGNGVDYIYGDAGDDIIYGGYGNDFLSGRDDNDLIYGEAGEDQLYGGNGTDTLYGGDDNDYLDGHAGDDTLYGDAGNDTLYGNTGNDTIYGGVGNDTAYGDAGDDIIYGGDGNDFLSGRDDNDVIYGEAGEDQLFGGNGTDTLYGGADDDFINGHAGNDILNGGQGSDDLQGSSGADRFVFDTIADFIAGDMDTIVDFTSTAGDSLDIADLLSNYNSGVDDINDFITFTEAGGNSTLNIDCDGLGGSYSSVAVVQLSSVTGLSSADVQTLINNGTVII